MINKGNNTVLHKKIKRLFKKKVINEKERPYQMPTRYQVFKRDLFKTPEFVSDYGCYTSNMEIKNKLYSEKNAVTASVYRVILFNRFSSVIRKQPYFN